MTVTLRVPRLHALAALIAALVFLGHVRVHVTQGCAMPLPALVLAAGLAVCAIAALAAAYLAWKLRPVLSETPWRN